MRRMIFFSGWWFVYFLGKGQARPVKGNTGSGEHERSRGEKGGRGDGRRAKSREREREGGGRKEPHKKIRGERDEREKKRAKREWNREGITLDKSRLWDLLTPADLIAREAVNPVGVSKDTVRVRADLAILWRSLTKENPSRAT